MKKNTFIKKLHILLMAFCLTFAMVPTQAASAATAANAASSVKNGWVKEKNGYCYYANGKILKNQWKTVKKKKYYLGSDGVRKTGWYSIKNKAYYFNSNGVCKKTRSIDKKLISEMDKILKKQKITASTKDKAALKKLFAYARKNFSYARAPLGFTPSKTTRNWQYSFAKEMLVTKKGSCYHDAAAFACMAKRATGLDVRICLGKSNAFQAKNWQYHAWVEIKISGKWYTYDTNAAKFSNRRAADKWYQQKHSSMEGSYYKTQKKVNVEL